MYCKILILLSQLLAVYSALAPTHLLVTRVGPCSDEPTMAVTVSELSITTQTYDSSLSGTLNVTQDISNGWKIKVTMQKCLDLRNEDTCDHLRSFFVVNNGCSDEDDDEQDIYSLLFHYVNPMLECPIQAGFYKLVDYPFFTEDNYIAVYESKISTSVFGYIYRIEGFSAEQEKILCLEAFLQLLYIREHIWVYSDVKTTSVNPLDSNESDDAGEKTKKSREEIT